MALLRSIYTKILLFGVTSSLDFETAKRIILCNQISVIFILISTPYSLMFYHFGNSFLSVSVLPFEIAFLACLLLNILGHVTLARAMLILASYTAMTFYPLVIGPESGIQFGLFSLIVVAAIIFEPELVWLRRFFLLLPVVTFFVLELTKYPSFYRFSFSSDGLWLLRCATVVAISLVLYLLIRFYDSINSHLKNTIKQYISIQTYMELIQCAPSKAHIEKSKNFLNEFGFEVIPFTQNIGHRAAIYIEEYSGKTGIRTGDAIIAATAVENDCLLVSANKKTLPIYRTTTTKGSEGLNQRFLTTKEINSARLFTPNFRKIFCK